MNGALQRRICDSKQFLTLNGRSINAVKLSSCRGPLAGAARLHQSLITVVLPNTLEQKQKQGWSGRYAREQTMLCQEGVEDS